MTRIAAAAVVMLVALHAIAARADLWAYVDEQGRSHVANHQVDSRYQLFFKGDTTLDVPTSGETEREHALAALVGTPLYARATDERLSRRYASLIETHARANGLDPALVKAVIAVESSFDPVALSARGAIGLMQIIPETGARYGLVPDDRRDVEAKLRDPAINVRIGTRYLRDLLARFGNDVSLALAAYNAGEGNVVSRANTVPPFAETRDYVRLVRQVYALYRPPATPPVRPVRLITKERPR
jgi:soluble lytic murein transglycosylase-like protein